MSDQLELLEELESMLIRGLCEGALSEELWSEAQDALADIQSELKEMRTLWSH